ncbi:glycine cleavage system protein GcvH [Acholeplasma vituli]|uniref:Glycine cleavage system H protein n=1 Tax=Paracholeplasma vituli TaxID=69473 RepID=A0ABT2PTW3_9MOLU|nr:glycine cleavage system protein GcvH [Paracholeplasma vituli]MCU0104398.1 glycine cleavage system protein GcvH [Paracholeplasma vituli]
MEKIVKGLLYAPTHEWIKIEGNKALIGITDYAQHSLGSVVFVDLPNVGSSFDQFEPFGAVESVKAASDLMMPVSGKVLRVNEALSSNPEVLNEDAFQNWMIEIEVKDASEVSNLLSPEAYEKTLH